MAKDEKGLQPIAEILSAMSDRATRGATLQRVDGDLRLRAADPRSGKPRSSGRGRIARRRR